MKPHNIDTMTTAELEANEAKLVAAQTGVPAAITKLSDDIDRLNGELADANFMQPLDDRCETEAVKLGCLIEAAQAERSALHQKQVAAATLLRAIRDVLKERASSLVYRGTQFMRDDFQSHFDTVLPQARATLSSALALHALLTGTKPREHDLLRFIHQIVGDPVEPATIIYNDARKAAVLALTAQEEKIAAFHKQAADRKAARANSLTAENV